MSFHRILIVTASLIAVACGGAPSEEGDSDEGALEQGGPAPSASVAPPVVVDAGTVGNADADAGSNANADADAGGEAFAGEYMGPGTYQLSLAKGGHAILSAISSTGQFVTIAEGPSTGVLTGPEGDTCPGYDLRAIDLTTIEVALADGTARASCDVAALGVYKAF